LRRRLRARVLALLAGYKAKTQSFGAAKDALGGMMKELATIVYTDARLQ